MSAAKDGQDSNQAGSDGGVSKPAPTPEFDRAKKFSDFIGMLLRLVVLAFGAILTYDLSLKYNAPVDAVFKASAVVFAALALRLVIGIQAAVAEWAIPVQTIKTPWRRVLVRVAVATLSYVLASVFLLAISFPIVALIDERGAKTRLTNGYLRFFGEDPATARRTPIPGDGSSGGGSEPD